MMKKVSPKITVLVGLLVVLIAMSGGVYAWFRASDAIGADKVVAGTISLENRQGCQIVVDDILPGEAVDMGNHEVYYVGNRKALIQISLGTKKSTSSSVDRSRILTKPLNSNKDWLALDPAIKGADYELKDGFYRYTEKRLHEIAGLRDAGTTPDLYQGSDGNFYIIMEPNTGVNLALATFIAFEGEFGGLYDNGSGTLSPSRQFEQASQFHNMVISIEAIQITEAAIEETWGTAALTEIAGLPIYPQLQAESTWNL